MSPLIPVTLVALAIVATTVFLLRPFVAARRVGWAGIGLVAAAPVAVLVLYWAVGEPAEMFETEGSVGGTTKRAVNGKTAVSQPARGAQAGSISTLVEGLAARLESGNGDADDWLLLAQSYEHLGRPEEGWAAYEEAMRGGSRDDALAQRLLFARVDAPARDESAGFRIRGTLEIDAAARAAIPPGATVFVIARATDGPPMPLAVARYTADTFPLSFELDAGDLMLPATEVSRYERFTVYAKVSPGGDVSTILPGIESSRAQTARPATPVLLTLHSSNDS